MKEPGIARLRRRLRSDRHEITHIQSCCVSGSGEIIAVFDQPLAVLAQEEAEELIGLFRRVLAGTLWKNQFPIAFSTEQAAHGAEYRLLLSLRDSALADQEAVRAFFERAADSLHIKGSYLILLACDRTDEGTFLLCGVCPVKLTKPALGYRETSFHNLKPDSVVSPPELGFLFPSFDGGQMSVYHALYHTRGAERHEEFLQAVFQTELPPPPAVQKEAFQTLLSETLDDECGYEAVQSFYEQIGGLLDAAPDPDTGTADDDPLLSKEQVKSLLQSCGVSEENISSFDTRFDAAFGVDTDLRPADVLDTRQLSITTPEVTIYVAPEHSGRIQTRTIRGVKYILIRADDSVQVNGVSLSADRQEWPELEA